ncbi:MAG TPA: hypothetical protein VJT31_34810 [Rugosimonospora sp.]|nr:hypothetical protein [Rugosimonospora sp.]
MPHSPLPAGTTPPGTVGHDGVVRVISAVLGVALLLTTMASMLRNLIVPRGLRSILVRNLWGGWRVVLLGLSRPQRRRAARRHGDPSTLAGYETLDAYLAWLAPLIVISTLAWWLLSLFIGFGLLLHAVSGLPLLASFREAGSSLFTLGFASSVRLHLTAIDFLAAATGPLVIALQIAYLPTLYAAYNRREVEVTLLQSRAAEPAWGPELLARQALVGTVDELRTLYQSWERLAADIGESHANYPVLLSFRSPRPYRGWVIALLAVMDAAAMHMALVPTGDHVPTARLMLRAAFTGLRDIARVTGIPFDTDPMPDETGLLTFAEYADAVEHLRDAGFLMQRDAAESWPHFRGWRVNYEAAAHGIAAHLDLPPALWSGPRTRLGQATARPARPAHREPGTPDDPGDSPRDAETPLRIPGQ